MITVFTINASADGEDSKISATCNGENLVIQFRDANLMHSVEENRGRPDTSRVTFVDEEGNVIGTYNFPVGGHVVVDDGQTVSTGATLVKIPRAVGGAGDITGGLPRVTELFEARNPSNPAVVSEIDGEVTMGKENGRPA